jgi:DNA primase
MISKKSVDEILLVTKIEEVVGDFVSLKKRGLNWVGLCPFHNDKNPSMYVSPRLGIYKCFVCDSGGPAVHFLMEHEKITYPEALRYLAKKYNIPIEEEAEKSAEELAAESERDSLFILNAFAENFFIDQLFNTEEGRAVGLSYFKERGYNEASIRKFKLGYCPENWDSFTQFALKEGYKTDFLLKTGLTKKSESGKLFDFYHGRVIFPIHNTMGKTAGFGGRILKKEGKIVKYFNSPESEIYHKSDLLYGFFFAKKAIRNKDNVYLVEGYTDVMSLSQAGIENVVSSSGTALTEGQIKLLASQTQNITVVYDGDVAGVKASLRGINMLLEAGLNVKVILLPDDEDPDSFARTHRDSEVTDYFEKNTTDFLLFKAKVLSKDAGNDPMKRAAMVTDIINTIADVKDNIARAFYIKECAEIFQLSEDMLNAQLRKSVWKKLNKGNEPAGMTAPQPLTHLYQPIEHARSNPLDLVEKNIILLILKHGMYEIDVEEVNDEGVPFLTKLRIDQYIFNEFEKEEIRFKSPLFQKIYEAYAVIAVEAEDQDSIKKAFTLNPDREISNFTTPYLIEVDPLYSPDWERRFETATNTINNNIQKLNNEVENMINMFKLRLLENHKQLLIKELKHSHPEDIQDQITTKLMLVLKRRQQIADLLGTVVTR